jgi:hypothetical protein
MRFASHRLSKSDDFALEVCFVELSNCFVSVLWYFEGDEASTFLGVRDNAYFFETTILLKYPQ